MINYLLTQKAVRNRFGSTTDDYNNVVVNDTVVDTKTYPCRLEQGPSTEITLGANTQISNWVIYLPPDADVKGTDVLEVDSQKYEVLGPPTVSITSAGPHHKTAQLTVVV
jgi:hypothetical protein